MIMPKETWEQALIEFLANGYTTPEIANKLKYSKLTIDTYRVRLLRKYAARNSAHLVCRAYELGILKVE